MKKIFAIALLIPAALFGEGVVVSDVTPPPPPLPPPSREARMIAVDADAAASEKALQIVAPLVAPTNGWFPVRTVSVQISHDADGRPTGAQAIIVADIAPADLEKVRAGIAPLWGMPEAVASRPITSVAATIATNGAANVTLTFR